MTWDELGTASLVLFLAAIEHSHLITQLCPGRQDHTTGHTGRPTPVWWLVGQQGLSSLRSPRDEVWGVGLRTGGQADPNKISIWQSQLRTATLYVVLPLPP